MLAYWQVSSTAAKADPHWAGVEDREQLVGGLKGMEVALRS